MKHLIVGKRIGQDYSFTPVLPSIVPPEVERLTGRAKREHAGHLVDRLESALARGQARRERHNVVADNEDCSGTLLRFAARTSAGIDLEFFKQKHGLELLSSRGTRAKQEVRVFAPDASIEKLAAAANKYGVTDDRKAKRRARYSNFFDRIGDASLAGVAKLWNSDAREIPRTGRHDFEVWIRTKALRSVELNASRFNLVISSEAIHFPSATVIVLSGTYDDLKALIEATAAAIEIRPASGLAVPPQRLMPRQRVELAKQLAERVTRAQSDAPRTTIVDTGVWFSHPLLCDSLPPERVHAIATGLVREDAHGHGTHMAGAALFGDLNRYLHDASPIALTTSLESVAVFDGHASPFKSAAEAVAKAHELVERQSAARVYSLSFSTPDDPTNGLPSAVSSLIDRLAFARDGRKRLICTAAGNLVTAPTIAISGYIGANDEAGIATPGQAVNALTVGAYTDLDRHGSIAGHAPKGDLCPTARTSMSWERHLAIKPEIVMEGGNRVVDAEGTFLERSEELSVLTTNNAVNRPFWAGTDTSIATAAAAGLATRLMAEYPRLWPETIRGLIVHSARWTDAMRGRRTQQTFAGAYELLRRFGWGVPDEARAFASAENRLTLVIEDELQHLQKGKTQYNAMRLYDLPWPLQALQDLGREQVSLRLTLSYFAEPHPLAVNFDRDRDYFSHGLKFDLKHPDDDREVAVARLNKHLNDKYEALPGRRPVGQWVLGERARAKGTLRQDEWTGEARDLAAMNAISIVPQYGWWKDFPTNVEPQSTVRFALIASITTHRTDVGLMSEAQTALNALPIRPKVAVET